ncbi:MAG TPA: TlpA disulfide reductase family protein [Cyclobacteriaceae bacterium]|nr:TlpA disulfide reductase family protein [Cyclobacteriaceae bacterium]HQQ95705.1 TlpA disulfide reductase family protein [Cyclobacteriaceae bacterium]
MSERIDITKSSKSLVAVPLLFSLLIVLSVSSLAQEARLIHLSQFQEDIRSEKGKIQVINFWATWCAPCLKELPLFEKLKADRPDIRIRLVSMDMDLDPNPDKVRRFVARKKLTSEVIILDERNPNKWIDQVEKKWSGALPATLIINNQNGKRVFVERELHAGELEKLISEVSQ